LSWLALLAAAALSASTQQLPPVLGEGEVGPNTTASHSEVDTRRPADLGIDPVRALSGVPGVLISDRRNEAQDPRLVVRGFGARAAFGIRGVRLVVDGIPASMPDGQGQLSHVPWSADAVVTVERGPLAILSGAAGAVIRVQTLPELAPTAQAEMVIGGGNRQRLSAEFASVDGAAERYSGIAALGYHNGGFRPHSSAHRAQVGARWQQLGLGGRWQLVAHGLRSRADDPLGLNREDFLRDPDSTVSNAARFDTRKQLDHGELGWSWSSLDDEIQVSAYAGHRAIEQFLAIPTFVQAAPTQSGAVINLRRRFGGLSLNGGDDPEQQAQGWRYRLSVEQQREQRRGFENFRGDTLGVRGALRRDEQNRATSSNAVIEGWWGTQRQQLHAGLRLTQVRMSSDDAYIVAGNPDDSGSATDSALLPAVEYRWQPTETVRFNAAFSLGLEVPTLAERAYSVGGSGFNAELDASEFGHAELGMRWSLSSAWQLAASLYQIDSKDELAVAESSGGRTVFRNAAEGRRHGLELALSGELGGDWSARLSANWIDARIDAADGDGQVNLPGQPARWGQLSMEGPLGSRSRAGIDWQLSSATPVNANTNERAPGYGRLDLWWSRPLGGKNAPVLSLRVDNLFDRRYAGSVIVGERNGRYYEPAPGRELGLGLRWEWR